MVCFRAMGCRLAGFAVIQWLPSSQVCVGKDIRISQWSILFCDWHWYGKCKPLGTAKKVLKTITWVANSSWPRSAPNTRFAISYAPHNSLLNFSYEYFKVNNKFHLISHILHILYIRDTPSVAYAYYIPVLKSCVPKQVDIQHLKNLTH